MSVVETERADGVMVIRMNRPERMNALGAELREALAAAWCEFRDSRTMEVAIFTGTGRAFCGGDDHGFIGGLAHAVATEMAFAFRFSAERLHELGFLNRLVDDADELLPTA